MTCWMDWLENVGSRSIWEICSFISQPTLDGGWARVPDLIVKAQGQPAHRIQENEEKGNVFRSVFFPPKPPILVVLDDTCYPPPAWEFCLITGGQIEHAFKRMKPLKATKLGTVPNCILSRCADLLAPHIGPVYRATFTLKEYPEIFSATNTIILWKPGKPDYEDPQCPSTHHPVWWMGKRPACYSQPGPSHLVRTHGTAPRQILWGMPRVLHNWLYSSPSLNHQRCMAQRTSGDSPISRCERGIPKCRYQHAHTQNADTGNTCPIHRMATKETRRT